MTGNAPEDYGDACDDVGMDGFITKPVDLAQLRELLEAVTAAPGAEAGAPAGALPDR